MTPVPSSSMLRSTLASFAEATAVRTSASSSSRHNAVRCLSTRAASSRPASATQPSSSRVWRQPAASFSSSISRWSETAGDKKSSENAAAGEAMGTADNKPADEKSGETDPKAEFEKQLAEKDRMLKELKDQTLYLKADLQNAQRRAVEEKAQASDYAITKLARDLTSSLDILQLALRSVPEPLRKAPADAESEDPRKAVSELYSGVDLTSKSIIDMLKGHGITQFDPTGEKFNPNEHEAMYQAPVPGKEPGTVLECSKSGFKIKGRVLRAAQVGVVQGQ